MIIMLKFRNKEINIEEVNSVLSLSKRILKSKNVQRF